MKDTEFVVLCTRLAKVEDGLAAVRQDIRRIGAVIGLRVGAPPKMPQPMPSVEEYRAAIAALQLDAEVRKAMRIICGLDQLPETAETAQAALNEARSRDLHASAKAGRLNVEEPAEPDVDDYGRSRLGNTYRDPDMLVWTDPPTTYAQFQRMKAQFLEDLDRELAKRGAHGAPLTMAEIRRNIMGSGPGA